MLDILGIGECMIELDITAPMGAHSSITPQVGGDVYNTLVAMSKLGRHSGFYTHVAQDTLGGFLKHHFDAHGIDQTHVTPITTGNNGLYFAMPNTSNAPHHFIYYRQGSVASQMTPQNFQPSTLHNVEILYATGITQALSKTCQQTVLKAFELAKQHNILVAYDPNYRPRLWKNKNDALAAMIDVLPYVDVLLPSHHDIEQLFQFEDTEQALDYFHLRGVPLIALKQGDQGATLGFKGKYQHIDVHPAFSVVDTIGAGDAFNGGFLYGILKQHSFTACAQMGAYVASKSLSQQGPIAGLPSLEQFNSEFKATSMVKKPPVETPPKQTKATLNRFKQSKNVIEELFAPLKGKKIDL